MCYSSLSTELFSLYSAADTPPLHPRLARGFFLIFVSSGVVDEFRA